MRRGSRRDLIFVSLGQKLVAESCEDGVQPGLWSGRGGILGVLAASCPTRAAPERSVGRARATGPGDLGPGGGRPGIPPRGGWAAVSAQCGTLASGFARPASRHTAGALADSRGPVTVPPAGGRPSPSAVHWAHPPWLRTPTPNFGPGCSCSAQHRHCRIREPGTRLWPSWSEGAAVAVGPTGPAEPGSMLCCWCGLRGRMRRAGSMGARCGRRSSRGPISSSRAGPRPPRSSRGS